VGCTAQLLIVNDGKTSGGPSDKGENDNGVHSKKLLLGLKKEKGKPKNATKSGLQYVYMLH